jgi:argininosuccinate synthase
MTAERRKVVLAYSGGLDTSIILKWLQTELRAEVVTFTADLGQGEEVEPARRKAELLGVRPENIFIEDLREEFVRDFVFPMFRANALYEGQYLLGTAISGRAIAKRQVEIARMIGADALCHGATGKGNDQVRFELGYQALDPDLAVIAPWREWGFTSREQLIAFAPLPGTRGARRLSPSTQTCFILPPRGKSSRIRQKRLRSMCTSVRSLRRMLRRPPPR